MKHLKHIFIVVFCIATSAVAGSQLKGEVTASQVNMTDMDIRYGDPVQVKIVYCGPCGYSAKVNKLKQQIKDEFGNNVEFSTESTSGITGYFEVKVNGSLVHSKKEGDGFVDTDKKLQKIIDAITDAL